MRTYSDRDETSFHFLAEFSDCIAHVANSWAYLEYYVNSCIWTLAGTTPAQGACITSQIYTINARIDALLSLMKLRQLNQNLITRVNKFQNSIREVQDIRNRIVHDLWFNDNYSPDNMGKLRITAIRDLKFGIDSIAIEALRADLAKIEERRYEAGAIRTAVDAALPSLPELPRHVLHPIQEDHSKS